MPRACLECLICAARFPLGPLFHGCPTCAQHGRKAALVVRYSHPPANFPDRQRMGIWRWTDLLPSESGLSLGEGATPLVPLRRWKGPVQLLVKNETCNPTWSYKDRAAAVSISMAADFGFTETVAISTGNLGNAVAAYSSSAGLGCTIFCNVDAPDLQLALMRRYGARVFRGGNHNVLVRKLVARGGVFPATIACPLGGFANPYGIEGFKTIAFEIFYELGRVPDCVFAPAGSGDGLFGIWKGFQELLQYGIANRLPRMIACQADGAACYAAALAQGSPRPIRFPHPHTVALSIAEEIGGLPALDAIRASGGDAIAVTDSQILAAADQLAREGIALEPASASTLAAATLRAEATKSRETWVLIGTGAIVKWPPVVTRGLELPPALPPDYEDLDALL